MTKGRDFDTWLSRFTDTISTYSYYVDFDKVVRNADELRRPLNAMNSLIGSKDIEREFLELVREYPSVVRCIPTLIAVRGSSVKVLDAGERIDFDFSRADLPAERYAEFMRRTGLFDMMSNHLVGNLYDYVLGVETGLDSNGRKNRGGSQMEDLVESYLRRDGIRYRRECYLGEIEGETGLDLSAISNSGTTEKRFDFVAYGRDAVYGIEVNFYTSSGSKLNETARSYKTLALEAEGIPGFEFVWVTDGKGWLSARNNLRETFDVMENIYCIGELEEGCLKRLIEACSCRSRVC